MKPIIKHLTDFLNYSEIERGLSAKTQENYTRFLQKFFKWLIKENLAELKPEELTEEQIFSYRVFLSRFMDPVNKKLLMKSTQNYYLIALRALLEYFVEKNIKCLPPSKIKLAKDRSEREIKFLNLDQLKKLMAAPNINTLAGLRDRAILESFFSTGLRVSELANLSIDDVKIRPDTKDLEMAVKGKGSKVRAIYFSDRAIGAIRAYLAKRMDTDPALFINFQKAAMKTGDNRRLTVKGIEGIVKKYVKISGLPVNATPHTLRHSFATDMLANGVDLRLVQEFLGHKNISTTQIYTHVTSKQLRDVHRKVHEKNHF